MFLFILQDKVDFNDAETVRFAFFIKRNIEYFYYIGI